MFDILKEKDFWIVSCCHSIVLFIFLSVYTLFFPNEFEQKGQKKTMPIKAI